MLVPPASTACPGSSACYQAGSLWDASEMGEPAEVHCYTPAELERKIVQLAGVRRAADRGLELLPEPA